MDGQSQMFGQRLARPVRVVLAHLARFLLHHLIQSFHLFIRQLARATGDHFSQQPAFPMFTERDQRAAHCRNITTQPIGDLHPVFTFGSFQHDLTTPKRHLVLRFPTQPLDPPARRAAQLHYNLSRSHLPLLPWLSFLAEMPSYRRVRWLSLQSFCSPI